MKTTDDLLKVLNSLDNADELSGFLSDPAANALFSTFADYYLSLEKVKNTDNAELISKSNIERTYWYQLINKTRIPRRDKILAMCIAAGLSAGETQRGLEIAGTGILYARNRRDAIIIYALNNGLGLDGTQQLLMQFDEKVIG